MKTILKTNITVNEICEGFVYISFANVNKIV
jgi:hypothetical protein